MSNGNSLINLGDLSKPATVLIEKISDALGGIFRPYQIRRVAQAEGDADKIREVARIEVTELHRRALQRFIQEEAKRQDNIENITRLALPEVSAAAKPEQVADDWITDFFDKCRLISDGDMQRLWARVLAGEANNPGKYSKRTVSLLSSLDKSDAELFTRLCSFGWLFGGVIPLIYDASAEIYSKAGLTFVGLTHLNDIGLVRYESVAGFQSTGLKEKALLFYYGTPVMIQFPKPDGNNLDLGHMLLSKAGQELAPLCGSRAQEGFLDYVLERWRKGGLKVEVLKAEQGAPPNGGPATPVGNSGVTEGPPSVS
jgi:hypothetical protein